MACLCYSLNGQRHEIRVPFHEARFVNRRLFLEGAAVYWTFLC